MAHRGAHRHRQPRGRLALSQRRFPGERRLPEAATIVRATSRTGLRIEAALTSYTLSPLPR